MTPSPRQNRRPRWHAIAAVLLMAVCSVTGAPADRKSSLTDSDIEFAEAKVTLQIATQENAELKLQVSLAGQQVAALTQSLALASSQAEVFKRETSDLKLRLEALGLDAASPDKALLEQRLLKAVSDLKIVSDQKEKLTEQLLRVNEAVLRYLKNASSTDGQARMALETELRSSSQLLGVAGQTEDTSQTPAGSLTDARVLSVKEELALVVANLGRAQGAKIGMPFQVWRGQRKIGLVRVVDVRERISGAVIQSLDPNEKIKVGDILRVDAQL